MRYRKITLEVILDEDGAEVYMQALADALDRIEEMQPVYSSEMGDEETATPADAGEAPEPD